MKTWLIWLVCISLICWRWWMMPKVELNVGQRVRLVVPTVDFPEYSDSATILRRGKWEVRMKDYVVWEPGEVVEVEGEWDGRRIMSDQYAVRSDQVGMGLMDRLLIGMSYVRKWALSRLEQVLPDPEASLAIGILLGVRRRMSVEFYQQLVNTGTLHIVAASGFNVMVVGGALIATMSRIIGKAGGIGVGVVGIWLYVLLAGASASVVRAGVMGSLTLIAYYWGRVAEARRLLGIATGIMLMVNPLYIVDVGFQLSVAATAGLLYWGSWMDKWMWSWTKEYLAPTLAATVATAPIIWFHFGRVSLLSPLVNLLVLPVVPLSMMLSALTLFIGPVAYMLYVPLWWMVEVIEWLG